MMDAAQVTFASRNGPLTERNVTKIAGGIRICGMVAR